MLLSTLKSMLLRLLAPGNWILPSFPRRPHLAGVARDQLVQHCLSLLGADDATEALDMLARSAVAADRKLGS